jgi:ABC-type xylose transport system permease subunit
MIALVFLSVGGLIGLYAGYDVHFESIPGFIRLLILVFIFSPVFQWAHLRYPLYMGPMIISSMLFACGVVVLSIVWFEVAPDISGTYEAAACTGLILLSQRLYLHKLRTYFKRSDLI